MTASPNDHIREYLHYYAGVGKPSYAVLLCGPWGCGKTWFIRDFLRTLNAQQHRTYFVSVNGLRSTEAIDAELFRQTHPILASKGVRLLGSIAGALLRSSVSLSVPMPGTGEDASVQLGALPGVSLPDASLHENAFLVFDDLERCALPHTELLGYINTFVEGSSLRVVLIANEAEFGRSDQSGDAQVDPSYRRIKEKVIGRTFGVQPEFDAALTGMLSDFEDGPARAYLSTAKAAVESVYRGSGLKNLRLLQHALRDFVRIFSAFSDEVRASRETIDDFLRELLALSFEIGSGRLQLQDISKARNPFLEAATRLKGTPQGEQPSKGIRDRYPEVSTSLSPVSDEIWARLFESGDVPKEELNAALLRSRHLAQTQRPSWVKLWWGFTLSDDDFRAVLQTVLADWDALRFDSIVPVLHTAGMLLDYSVAGLCEKTASQIVEEAERLIASLQERGLLKPLSGVEGSFVLQRGAAGLGYRASETPEFARIVAFTRDTIRAVEAEETREAGRDLVGLLGRDPDLFRRALTLSNDRANRFFNTPVLLEVDPRKLTESLMTMPFESRTAFEDVLRSRYQFESVNLSLASELPWLREVEECLRREAEIRHGQMSGYVLEKVLIPLLLEAAHQLEKASSTAVEASSAPADVAEAHSPGIE